MRRVIARRAVGFLLVAACQTGGPKASSSSPNAGDAAPGTAARQPTAPPKVDAASMRSHVEVLASDEYAGRYTLNPESIERAAMYLATAHRKLGLRPAAEDYLVGYQFSFGSEAGDRHHAWIEVDGKSTPAEPGEFRSLSPGQDQPVIASAVFVGDLAKATAKKPPAAVKGKAAFALVTLPLGDATVASLDALMDAGAKAVVLVPSAPGPLPGLEASPEGIADLPRPVVLFDRATADRLIVVEGKPLAELGKGKHLPVEVPGMKLSLARVREDVTRTAPNVVAVLPGTDLADEIVMLGAHYDHIGTSEEGHMCFPPNKGGVEGDEVCNGADDNASGTAMTLAIAEAFAKAGVRPRRTLVFAHFSGEELGLHGSRMLAEKPPFPSGKVVAMVNLDMVGRLGAPGLSIGAVATAPQWMSMLRKYVPSDIQVVYERSVTARSDHASYYRKNVPVLFFFTGLHDDYHRNSDHADKVNYEGMAKIADIVTGVVFELSQGAEIAFAPPSSASEGEVTRLPGSDPATLEKK